MKTEKHYYGQQIALFNKGVTNNLNETIFSDTASIKYSSNDKSSLGNMDLLMKAEDYQLKLQMTSTKEPVWHCEDGKLQMGILDDLKQVTYYFSFTNLLIEGILNLDGKTHKVKGKGWFDKQGGPYQLTNPKTN